MNTSIENILNILIKQELKSFSNLKNVNIQSFTNIYELTDTAALTFYKGNDLNVLEKYADFKSACILVPLSFHNVIDGPFIFTEDPQLAFIHIYNFCQTQNETMASIHETAIIDKDCKIGKNTSVGAGSILGACVIGNNCTIGKGVIIEDSVEIGNNVQVYNGANLGDSGLGSIMNSDNNQILFPHVKKLIIHDNVVIGSETTIHKGSLKDTIIGKSTHISAKCFIAHNCNLGENIFIAPNVNIAGSVNIGDRSYIALNVSIHESCILPNSSTVGINVCLRENKNTKTNHTYLTHNNIKLINGLFGQERIYKNEK